jgi:acetyl-CoA carboxylase biotin carboxyl carrier protein
LDLTRQDLVDILRIVEQTDVEYLEIEAGANRLTVSKTGAFLGSTPAGAAASNGQPAPSPQPAPVAATEPVAHAPAAAPAPVSAPATAGVPEGCVAISAPSVGVFYPRPEPGAPPFVEVGSRVEAGATVGLIEVMKVFNAVVCPVDGVIEAVLVGEQELVEYGQDLFAVRADA